MATITDNNSHPEQRDATRALREEIANLSLGGVADSMRASRYAVSSVDGGNVPTLVGAQVGGNTGTGGIPRPIQVIGRDSVQVAQTANLSTVQLVGDSATPAKGAIYGASTAGVLGYQAISTLVSAGTNITVTVNADGSITISSTGGGGSLSSPLLIQSAWINSAPSVAPSAVFGTAPAPGNLLVCLMFNWTTNSVATGWTQLQHAGTQDYCSIAIKQAANGESTTQTPYSSNSNGTLGIIFEIAGANSQSIVSSVVYPATGTEASLTKSVISSTTQGMILYMGEQQEFGTLPTLSVAYTGGGTHTAVGMSPENNSGGSGVPRIGYAGSVYGTIKGANTLTLSSTQTAYTSLSILYLGNAV